MQSLSSTHSSFRSSEPDMVGDTLIDKINDKVDNIFDKFTTPYLGAFDGPNKIFLPKSDYYYLPPQQTEYQ